MAREEKRCRQNHRLQVNYAASYWTPPLTPRLAFDLESRQIAESLQVQPLVSITDHDDIQAPMLLRTVASARHIPVSVEWTTPFGKDQAFHLGIHNLPSASGAEWMRQFEAFTANPSDARLTEMLSALHDLPNVLIVFNHPLWDLYKIGQELHQQRVEEFLTQNSRIDPRGGAEWPAQLGRESTGEAACGSLEQVADLRRRPAWPGAERQREPDASDQLQRVRV